VARLQAAALVRQSRLQQLATDVTARNLEESVRQQRRQQLAVARQQARQQARLAAVGSATNAATVTESCPWERDGVAVQKLLLPPLHGLPSNTQQEDPMPAYIEAATQFRTCVDARIQKGEAVCCVCARYLPLVTKDKGPSLPAASAAGQPYWQEVPAGDIPGKELLLTADHLGCDTDGNNIMPHSPELPRVGLTTYVIEGKSYCLEEAGIVRGNGEHQGLHPYPQLNNMGSSSCRALRLHRPL
jgi:hypothetical protein